MSSLTGLRAEVKILPCPRECPECNGAGSLPGTEGEPDGCPSCDGWGRAPVDDRSLGLSYLAVCGTDTIDISGEGESLNHFVDRVCAEWSLEDEDVCFWELPVKEGSGPVVVAILRANQAGELDLLRMEN